MLTVTNLLLHTIAAAEGWTKNYPKERLKMVRILLACAVAASSIHAAVSYETASYACTTTNTSSLPFCNMTMSFPDRVADLVGRLTIAEKLGLTSSTHDAVPRLGIPA